MLPGYQPGGVAQASGLPYRGFPIRLLAALLVAALALPLSALAQSYAIPWHTIDGGGGTSTGGVFRLSGTLGQPAAGPTMTGGNYSLTGGFWALPLAIQTPDAPTLTIVPAAPGFATIAWTPATGTTWVLQFTPTLEPPAWTDAPSGATHPVTVPATVPAGFYRLIRR